MSKKGPTFMSFHPLMQWLKKHKLSLREVAEACGTSHGYLVPIMQGHKHPGKELAKRIEHYTNGEVGILELLFYKRSTEDCKRSDTHVHSRDSKQTYKPDR